MRSLFAVFFLSVISVSLLGQGSISGTVVESASKHPVEYATVSVFKSGDTSPVKGTTCDASGKFDLTNIPFGEYEIKCSFLGFEMKEIKTFRLLREQPSIDIGILELTETAQSLGDIVVTGRKSTYINKIDRKVFNVGQDLMSASGSVSELMQNIPSIQVDIDGNVSLRGAGNVQVLINGKPSMMMKGATQANVLQQMSANNIERIEVITNPSAKYKPDGTSGIINIVTKREKASGFNGMLTANAGNNSRYNSTLSLNYKPGSVNYFANYGIRFDRRDRHTFDSRTITDENTHLSDYIDQNTNSVARPVSHLAGAGIDWSINKKSNLEISGSYEYISFLRQEDIKNIYKDNSYLVTKDYNRHRHDDEYEKNIELSAAYTYNFGEDHSLNINYTLSGSRELEDNKYTNKYLIPTDPESKDNTRIWQSGNENLINLAYLRPLGNGKLETGFATELDRADMNYKVENLVNTSWVVDDNKTNHFIFDENIFALYATYEIELGKFGIIGGLRGEQSYIKSKLITLNQNVPNNYTNLFPTLHTSYKLNSKNELQFNYSLRINRPEGDDLNPFPEYKDPTNISAGNPYLKPEKIHSVEGGYMYQNNSTTFIATLFYRNTFNKMTEVTKLLNDGTLLTTKENLSSSQSSGAEVILNTLVGRFATFNINSSAYYNVIDASGLGYSNKKSTITWTAAVNGNFNITKRLMAQVNARYRPKQLTPQGYNEASFIMNMGAKYDIFKKRAAITFTASDIFNTFNSVTVIDTDILKQRVERKRPSRIYYLGFTYNFGQSQKKQKESTLKYDESF